MRDPAIESETGSSDENEYTDTEPELRNHHSNVQNDFIYHPAFYIIPIEEWACCGRSGRDADGCQRGPVKHHTGMPLDPEVVNDAANDDGENDDVNLHQNQQYLIDVKHRENPIETDLVLRALLPNQHPLERVDARVNLDIYNHQSAGRAMAQYNFDYRLQNVSNDVVLRDLYRFHLRNVLLKDNCWRCCKRARSDPGCMVGPHPDPFTDYTRPNDFIYHPAFYIIPIEEWACCGRSGRDADGCQRGPVKHHTGMPLDPEVVNDAANDDGENDDVNLHQNQQYLIDVKHRENPIETDLVLRALLPNQHPLERVDARVNLDIYNHQSAGRAMAQYNFDYRLQNVSNDVVLRDLYRFHLRNVLLKDNCWRCCKRARSDPGCMVGPHPDPFTDYTRRTYDSFF